MPRFVVLEHNHPVLHWDFMLEQGLALRTWRLARPPAPGLPIEAEALGAHRLAYLEYEGPVSGNRGRVTRWDRGTFRWLTEEEERVVVHLEGVRLSGTAELVQAVEGWRFTLQAGAGDLASG